MSGAGDFRLEATEGIHAPTPETLQALRAGWLWYPGESKLQSGTFKSRRPVEKL